MFPYPAAALFGTGLTRSVWSTTDKNGIITISNTGAGLVNGRATNTGTSGNYYNGRGTAGRIAGSVYFEVLNLTNWTAGDQGGIGLATSSSSVISGTGYYFGSDANSGGYLADGRLIVNGVTVGTASQYGLSSVVGIWYNFSTNVLKTYLAGSNQHTYTVPGGTLSGTLYPTVSFHIASTVSDIETQKVTYLPSGASPWG